MLSVQGLPANASLQASVETSSRCGKPHRGPLSRLRKQPRHHHLIICRLQVPLLLARGNDLADAARQHQHHHGSEEDTKA